jgi:hypothetical protein
MLPLQNTSNLFLYILSIVRFYIPLDYWTDGDNSVFLQIFGNFLLGSIWGWFPGLYINEWFDLLHFKVFIFFVVFLFVLNLKQANTCWDDP